jgi:hypothetical protein
MATAEPADGSTLLLVALLLLPVRLTARPAVLEAAEAAADVGLSLPTRTLRSARAARGDSMPKKRAAADGDLGMVSEDEAARGLSADRKRAAAEGDLGVSEPRP